MQFGVGTDKFMFASGFEGLCENTVAVVVVDDHDVFVTPARGDRETAGLVAEDLARDFDSLLVDPMGSDALCGERGRRHDGCEGGGRWWRCKSLRGS